MSATTAETEPKALLEPPKYQGAPKAEKIVAVARKYGVSPFRQMREMFWTAFGRGRLPLSDYYNCGLYDPAIPMEQKREYVANKGSYLINKGLSPDRLCAERGFVANKVFFTALIHQLGFRTTVTQAVVSTRGHFGNVPHLANAGDIAGFLREQAQYPLFAKPLDYSGSFGSAMIERVEGDDIVLSNGTRLALAQFCAEVMEEYGQGFVFQDAITQHPELSDIIGRAIGTVRLVTIRDTAVPRPFYALWKIPAPKAMSDNFWQDGSMIAPLDLDTGAVGDCWIGTGLDARKLETHPVSGRTFRGFEMPHWADALDQASKAHALFPDLGVVGWDVAITEDGPLLIECNDNPFHTLYQLAFRRGIWNEDIRPVLERTTDLSKDMREAKKALQLERHDKRK
ncbi:MAG: sugar-transfer associated ATP-grasp domain-containing protein [Pseudomonadota bacterium]